MTRRSGLRTRSTRGAGRASMNSATGHRAAVARRGFRSAVRDEHSARGTPGAKSSRLCVRSASADSKWWSHVSDCGAPRRTPDRYHLPKLKSPLRCARGNRHREDAAQMRDDLGVPSRRSALVTLRGLLAICRRHAKGRARADRGGCAGVISDRGPGGRWESDTYRAERLGEGAERPGARVARLQRQRRGGEA